MSSILIVSVIYFFSTHTNSYLPNTIRNFKPLNPITNDNDTPALLLQQIFSYLTDDEISLLQNSTTSQCMGFGDIYDIDHWRDEYENNPSFRNIFQRKQDAVRSECEAMNLSTLCLDDCLYYNNVFQWIEALFDENATESAEVKYMVTLYSLSAGPFSYYDAGNPSMCDYLEGTYCFTPAMSTMFPIMQHACCLPGSCTGEDAINVLNSNTWCYSMFYDIYHNMSIPGLGNVEVLNVCEPIARDLDKAGPIIVILILFAFVAMVLIASVLKQYSVEHDGYTNSSLFVACFNIQDTWSAFKSVRPPNKTQYNFLDGIRVWSMSWVVFGHSFLFYLYAGSSNSAILIPNAGSRTDYTYEVQKFYMMLTEYGFYSVDSFFFLSGFLACFSVYRQTKKYSKKELQEKSCLWIPLAYVARILRLVPMMMYITAIQWQLSDQLSGGYHVTSRSYYTDACSDSWYMILFFYQNLYLSKNHAEALNCMGHLWYIQCDMQMYLFLPFIIFLFQLDQRFGLASAIIPVAVCVVIRVVFAFYYDFGANELVPGYPTKHGGDYNDDSYFKPWTRMAVYFIGVAAMLIFIMIDEESARRKKKFVLTKPAYFACLLFSCFILASLVFWPYGDVKDLEDRWSLFANQVYYALCRPSWGFGLALLSFALKYKSTENGEKSLVKTALSMEIYQPLGKLTYSMYLLHLLVFAWWAMDLEQPLYYDIWREILLYLGIWLIVAVFSVILWLFMEKPISNLTTAFVKWISGQKTSKVRVKKDSERYQQLNDNAQSAVSVADSVSINEKRSHLVYYNDQTFKEDSFTTIGSQK